jgi:hypothetical protein
MAHFAQLDENNIVINVIVVGDEYETTYAEWRKEFSETYVQTSYNNNIRKQYAGIGYFYDADADVFVAPQPFPSWTLDSNHDWQAPTPKPEGDWMWDESELSWVEVPVG